MTSEQLYSFDELESCKNGPKGSDLTKSMEKMTRDVKPKIDHLPWITINKVSKVKYTRLR